MNRRNFLKGLLGAAMVSTIPIPTFEAIVRKETPKTKEYHSKVWILNEHNEVIGEAETFNFEIHHEMIDVSSLEDGYSTYLPGQRSFNIIINNLYAPAVITMKKGMLERKFREGGLLKIIAVTDEYKMHCDCLLVEIADNKLFTFFGQGALYFEKL